MNYNVLVTMIPRDIKVTPFDPANIGAARFALFLFPARPLPADYVGNFLLASI